MGAAVSEVYYNLPNYRQATVQHLTSPEQVSIGHALAAGGLLAGAYAQVFEGEGPFNLPPGTFEKYFDMSRDNLRKRRHNMQAALRKGSQYWFIQGGPDTTSNWHGLAKTSPSRSSFRQKRHWQSPNCYLNDIVVRAARQHSGYGSALLHAAIVHGGFNLDRSLVLDGFVGNDMANAWFGRLGLDEAKAAGKKVEVPPFAVDGTNQLPMQRLTSEGVITLAGIARLLEQKVHETGVNY